MHRASSSLHQLASETRREREIQRHKAQAPFCDRECYNLSHEDGIEIAIVPSPTDKPSTTKDKFSLITRLQIAFPSSSSNPSVGSSPSESVLIVYILILSQEDKRTLRKTDSDILARTAVLAAATRVWQIPHAKAIPLDFALNQLVTTLLVDYY